MTRTITLAGMLALAGLAAPLVAQVDPTLAGQLETTLQDFHDRYAFPGATAAIVLAPRLT